MLRMMQKAQITHEHMFASIKQYIPAIRITYLTKLILINTTRVNMVIIKNSTPQPEYLQFMIEFPHLVDAVTYNNQATKAYLHIYTENFIFVVVY